jgi:ribonuclease E
MLRRAYRALSRCRLISDREERKRLTDIVGELKVPEGMGVILRGTSASRMKDEITADYMKLMGQWDSVRDLTLRSTAPTLVYDASNPPEPPPVVQGVGTA